MCRFLFYDVANPWFRAALQAIPVLNVYLTHGNMSTEGKAFKEYIPHKGLLHEEDRHEFILCKPKLIPLKSVTLEKMEKMQKEAEDKLKHQSQESQERS